MTPQPDVIRIIKKDGPQTIRELASKLNLGIDKTTNQVYLLKKKGQVEYSAKSGARNGRWHLSEQATHLNPQPGSNIHMHSLPLNRLPEYFRAARKQP